MRASTGATAWVWWVCGMLLLADRFDLNVASRVATDVGCLTALGGSPA